LNDPISNVVDSIASDYFSLILSVMSGIVVPILLVCITVYFLKSFRRSDKRQSYLDNVHIAIDNLYKHGQALHINNLKRKKHEDWSAQTLSNNNQHRDLLKWHLQNMWDLELQHSYALIDFLSAQTRLQHLLTEERTSALASLIGEIQRVSSKPGMITEKMMGDFVEELNSLMDDVDAQPEKWIKS